MAKASVKKSSGGAKAKPGAAKRSSGTRSGGSKAGAKSAGASGSGAGDAFIALLQSPLVAELVAVAATPALAPPPNRGFPSRSGGATRSKRAGKAVKEAGKAAAAAVGRRLSLELDEIKEAAKASKAGAKA